MKNKKLCMRFSALIIFLLYLFVNMVVSCSELVMHISATEYYSYTGNGSADFPYQISMESNGVYEINGAVLNTIKNSGQDVIYQNDLYSWEFRGDHIKNPDGNIRYPLNISVYQIGSSVDIELSEKGDLYSVVTLKIYVGNYFTDAAVVNIDYVNGSSIVQSNDYLHTGAVVEEGYIIFDVSYGGIYSVSKTYNSTGEERNVSNTRMTEVMVYEELSDYLSYKILSYKGNGTGTEEYPLTMLGYLNECADFKASWKSMNVVAGYSGDSFPAYDSYNPDNVLNVMIEDRDESTGKLRASAHIDGHKWDLTTESEKGPYFLSYYFNPNATVIKNALKDHAAYRRDKTKYGNANNLLNLYSESELTQLFFITRTRNFEGPITFKMDVSKYYLPGDTVDVQYVLGSSNANLYHSETPTKTAEELAVEEPTYSKYDCNVKVDYQGYISVDFYTGGFFTLTKDGVERPQLSPDEIITETTETKDDQNTQVFDSDINTDITSSYDSNINGDSDSIKTDDLSGSDNVNGSAELTQPFSTDPDFAENGIDPAEVKDYDQNGSEPDNPDDAELTSSDNVMIQNDNNQMLGNILFNEISKEKDDENKIILRSADSRITASGRLTEKSLKLEYTDKSSKINSIQKMLDSNEEASEFYDISLLGDNGKYYSMSGDDYLDITICLKNNYTVFDMQNLSLKYVKEDNTISDEDFISEEYIGDDGKAYIKFCTSHLSSFIIIKNNSDDNSEKPTDVRADANTSEAANLVKSKSETSDSKIPFAVLECSTIILLLAGLVIKTLKRRHKKDEAL